MSWVISIGGQKGGSGKSTVAQGLAVEAVRHGTHTILADMDLAQQSSVRWGERRRAAGIQPLIDARLLRAVSGIAPLKRLCDLLVVDTPAGADSGTLSLAKASDLFVLPAGPNALELEPTLMLIHSLVAAGIGDDRFAVALTKVFDGPSEAAARDYLKQAGYSALPAVLPFAEVTFGIANEGWAVTEAAQKSVAEPAKLFFAGIVAALDRVKERMAGPQPVPERDQSRERGDRDR
jgi:chromosome partitioning protein